MDNQPVFSQTEFHQQYALRQPAYKRLAVNLQQTLKLLLSERNIPYLEVVARVKDEESAYEKVGRKGYPNPFEQLEDWCGLRIICYYAGDIDHICTVLQQEFAVQTQEDTARRLAPHEFGYRSTHFILQIKDDWTRTPDYRGLAGIKAEVQVRTILMHAWAEIEHKLVYKKQEQAPDQFRRQLYRLSAKFEEADEQFEDIRRGLSAYQGHLREVVQDAPTFRAQELNLDTLQTFLDYAFSHKERNTSFTLSLLDELLSCDLTMSDIMDVYEVGKHHLPTIRKYFHNSTTLITQVGFLRMMLDVYSDKFFVPRLLKASAGSYSGKWQLTVEHARAFIGKTMPTVNKP